MNAIRLITLLLVCILVSMPVRLVAQDNANRTLFGNEAVQDDLQLTDEQRAKIREILIEMEEQIASELKSAKLDTEDADPKSKNAIIGPIVGKFGNRAMEVLDQKQKNRFWQIGAQSSGIGVFQNNRTARVLRLTKDQLQKMESINQKSADALRQAALNPALKTDELRALVEQELQKQYAEYLSLLSDDQRKSFDQLLGEPFDLDSLKTGKRKPPRALTFVFDLTWRNAYVLISDAESQKKIGINPQQLEKIRRVMKTCDERVSVLRLGILKGLEVDFSELDDDDKQAVALKINDGAHEMFRETEKQISELLTKDQIAALDRRLIHFIGVRAIGSERIADQLGLTPKQKQVFAEAEAEFERQTAPLRVVGSPKLFEQKKEASFKTAFETTAKSLLTTAQLEKLESLKKE